MDRNPSKSVICNDSLEHVEVNPESYVQVGEGCMYMYTVYVIIINSNHYMQKNEL